MSEWDAVSSPVSSGEWDAVSSGASMKGYKWASTNNPNIPGQKQMVLDDTSAPADTIDHSVGARLARAAGTTARTGYQGLTMGAGDEMQSALGAAIAYPIQNYINGDDVSYSDLYSQGLQSLNKDIRNDYKNNPEVALPATLAGGLMNGSMVRAGITKAVPALGSYLGNAKTFLGARGRDALVGIAGGAPSGFASADPTAGESRVEGGEKGAVIGGVLGPLVGSVAGRRIPGKSLSDLVPESLPIARDELGSKLGEGIMGAARTAKGAADSAYNAAIPATKKAGIYKDFVPNLADNVKASLADVDGSRIPQVNDVNRYLAEVTGKKGAVTLNDIEKLRRKISNMPVNKTVAEEGRARTLASKALDKSVDDMFEQGVIYGDKAALNMIKDARSKHAYYRQKFTNSEYNKVVKDYVKTNGQNMTPEQLLDVFTSGSKAGYNNIKTAKEILGSQATPILKTGFLGKLQKGATELDELGTTIVKPNALAKNIDNFLKDSPTIAKEVFTPGELLSLRQLSTSAKGLGKAPSARGRFMDKLRSSKWMPVPEKASIKLDDITTGSRQKTLYNRIPTNPSISMQPAL